MRIAQRKNILLQHRSMLATAPGALEVQRGPNGVHLADAHRVQRVGFGDLELVPVELRAPTGRLQGVGQRPARGVDDGGILQRLPGVRQDFVAMSRIVGEEVLYEALVLGLVARPTGQREVAHAVRATARLGVDVLDLQRHDYHVAIGACTAPILEQIFLDLEALLVLDARDLGVLQSLQVEAHQFAVNRRDRHPALQAPDPRQRNIRALLQRR